MLKRYYQNNRKDLFFPLKMFLFFFLLIELITLILSFVLREDLISGYSLPLLVAPVLLAVGSIYFFLYSFGMIGFTFDQILSFSRTRTNTLRFLLCWDLVVVAASFALVLLLILVERTLTVRLLPLVTTCSTLKIEALIPLPQLPLILLAWVAASILGVVVSTLVRQFGSKAGWLLYLLFLGGLIFFNQNDSFFHRCLPWLLPTLGVLDLIGLIWSIHILRRTPIRI